jgi:NAD(P)-dependent dehydrogenase (short-subunit alcohol dehydrogenase family)
MVGTVVSQFGRLDILVNSAALDPKFDPQHQGGHSQSFEGFSLDAWNQALSVNLTGAFLCCQAAAQPMLEQEHGVFINICSTYGLVGPDQRLYEREAEQGPRQYKPVYYSVTKAGILGLTRYLSTYYAGKNIRANALTPGGVYNHHDDVFLKAYSARTVMGRMAQRDEMNGALLFLASEASSYMTGANLVVDGGWTAW